MESRWPALAWGLMVVVISARIAEAGIGMKYARIKSPEQVFEAEFRVYSAETLRQLIPSAEPPPQKIIYDELAGRQTPISSSGHRYIFGWVRYRRPEDVWTTTSVTLKIQSPNAPQLTEYMRLRPVELDGISDAKTYFLIPVPPGVIDISTEQVQLVGRFVKAGGFPNPGQ